MFLWADAAIHVPSNRSSPMMGRLSAACGSSVLKSTIAFSIQSLVLINKSRDGQTFEELIFRLVSQSFIRGELAQLN